MNHTAILATLALGLLTTGCVTPGVPTANLAGSNWRITTIDSAPAADDAQLAFAADSLSASAGCNRLAGDYTITGTSLAAGPLIATKMYCDGRMEHEAALGALLESGAMIAVDGDRLALTSAEHRLQAVRLR